MRVIVVGLGIQGRKRQAIAGRDVVATVDTALPADFRRIEDVPLPAYDAALVCTPDAAKPALLEYLLGNRKHVLVEKPLVSDRDEEIARLRDLALAKGVACYTAYNHRFEPHIVRMKETIDAGRIGKVYYVRMFYGNGTARDVRGSPWRDRGMGVIPDLGSHLLDTLHFWFGRPDRPFRAQKIACFETEAPDYVQFASEGAPHVVCEGTMVSWRNTFHADVIGEKGSAHIFCLCKWGPSVFTVRERVLPSGRPHEKVDTLECKDPTWEAEYAHFLKLCESPSTNLDNDLWLNQAFRQIWNEGRGVVR